MYYHKNAVPLSGLERYYHKNQDDKFVPLNTPPHSQLIKTYVRTRYRLHTGLTA